MSSLTTQMGWKLGPVVLGTMIQHFLRRDLATKDSKAREELLYDEAFTIVKMFMETATKHTVEELQAFSNTRIPAPPWVRTVRLLVPLSTCDKAADHLIDALGGKDKACEVAGGTRWWQVRGLEGVPAEWIMVRKDILAKRRAKGASHPIHQHDHDGRQGTKDSTTDQPTMPPQPANGNFDLDDNHPEPHEYPSEMDGTPCMLYVHGGGGYFGSIDQERYMMHRFARKMQGRVFAINYRLAPQYPFPCALHDVISAYLYLIDPPEGARHKAVDPSLVIPAGDSAGGNLIFGLLQVIRDAGLPQPAGAVLLSPWCDLTHSFPSCLTNAATDIIPPYGLSLHKPSPSWPPPNSLEIEVARSRFTHRLKTVVSRGLSGSHDDLDTETFATGPERHHRIWNIPHETTLLGDRISIRNFGEHPETHSAPGSPTEANEGHTLPSPTQGLRTSVTPGAGATLLVDGKVVTISSQIQFYCTNEQLLHPLVSPALGYLGGLPPLFIVASDKELLRDEIIYAAHKAAHPERYPLKEEVRRLYPALDHIEQKYHPTDVHLQVYDEVCHVLPMYSFTTPAKYCYRAIAAFCKYVTTRKPPVETPHDVVDIRFSFQGQNPHTAAMRRSQTTVPTASTADRSAKEERRRSLQLTMPNPLPMFRKMSLQAKRPKSQLEPIKVNGGRLGDELVVESPREGHFGPPTPSDEGHDIPRASTDTGPELKTAGNPSVYACPEGGSPFVNHMMRERVSTNGVLRPLESESKIPACTMDLEEIGVLNENSVRRYIDGQAKWEKKFASVARTIETRRMKELDLTRKQGSKTLSKLRHQLMSIGEKTTGTTASASTSTTREDALYNTADEDDQVKLSDVYAKTVLGSRQWTWGWALEGENPPPSSIVARGDTKEARRLGKFADRQLGPGEEEHGMSGNNLWSVVIESLAKHGGKSSGDSAEKAPSKAPSDEPHKRKRFPWFHWRHKSEPNLRQAATEQETK